jgi:hypothetical protein
VEFAMRRALVALALLGLSACNVSEGPYDPSTESFAFLEAEAYRAYGQSFSEYPFANGAMDVIATENGDMRTYRLVPCRGGTAICAGGLHGPAGRLERTRDYWIVTGLFGGRSFYLSPGGDGAIYYGGERATALAWNNVG